MHLHKLFRRVRNLHHYEVCPVREIFETEFLKGFFKLFSAGVVDVAAQAHEVVVVKGGKCGNLRERIDVERFAHPIDIARDFLGRVRVPNAQPREPVYF